MQIDGVPLTHSLYLKLINILDEVDFFQDTILYDEDQVLYPQDHRY